MVLSKLLELIQNPSYLKKSQWSEDSSIAECRIGQSISSQLQFQQQISRLERIKSSRRQLVDTVTIEIQLAEITKSRDTGLWDLSEIVVIEVEFDERVKERSVERLIVDVLKGVTVQDETEDGETLERVGGDGWDCSVKDREGVDLKKKRNFRKMLTFFCLTMGSLLSNLL